MKGTISFSTHGGGGAIRRKPPGRSWAIQSPDTTMASLPNTVRPASSQPRPFGTVTDGGRGGGCDGWDWDEEEEDPLLPSIVDPSSRRFRRNYASSARTSSRIIKYSRWVALG